MRHAAAVLLLLSTDHAAEAMTDAQKAAEALGDASLEDQKLYMQHLRPFLTAHGFKREAEDVVFEMLDTDGDYSISVSDPRVSAYILGVERGDLDATSLPPVVVAPPRSPAPPHPASPPPSSSPARGAAALSTGHAVEALTDAQKAAEALGDASLEDPPPPLTLPPPSSPARARVASSPMAKDERKAAAPGQRAERKAELLAALGNPWEGHLWQHNVLPFLQEHGYTLEQVLCTLALSLILTLTLTGVRGPNQHTDPKSNPYP